MVKSRKVAKRAAKRQAKKGKRAHEAVRAVIYDAPAAPQEDPRLVVVKSRARIMGQKAGDDMLIDMYGEPAGQAIAVGARNGDEARKLWALFKRFDAADDTYFRRIIGRSRFPNVARLEMMPERMETRDDDRPDDRSEDQKDRDASNNWTRWQGLIGHLATHERSAVISASRHLSGDLQKSGTLTTSGQTFIAAMRVLAEIESRA